ARREAGPFLYSPERRVAPDAQVISSTRMTMIRTSASVETPMVVESCIIAALLSACAAAMVVACSSACAKSGEAAGAGVAVVAVVAAGAAIGWTAACCADIDVATSPVSRAENSNAPLVTRAKFLKVDIV